MLKDRLAALRRKRPGLAPAELAAAAVIVLVLAAFAGPKLLQISERAKARAAFAYLSAVRAAQERYAERHSGYASELKKLHVGVPFPKGFVAERLKPGETGHFRDSWSLTLTRPRAALGYTSGGLWPIRYGSYDVIFNENGWDDGSTIPPHLNPAIAP